MAVSYTHLDVYKRQDLDELKRRCAEVKDFYDDLNVKLVRPAAVSYPHLDVYKRQPYMCGHFHLQSSETWRPGGCQDCLLYTSHKHFRLYLSNNHVKAAKYVREATRRGNKKRFARLRR